MAVVVNQSERGDKIYRSANGVDISIEEKDNADLLDQSIVSAFESLMNELVSKSYFEKREKVKIYWQLGRLTNSLLSKATLPKSEVSYFFQNLKLRLPKNLEAKDRGPNREHIKYCHRLGTYDESTVATLKWSEWVYLFDGSHINNETRFDKWFNKVLREDSSFFDRTNVRLMGKLLKIFFDRLETSDLSDVELERCYCEAKVLCGHLKSDSTEDIKTSLKNLKSNRILLAKIIDGRITGQELYGLI